MKKKKSFNFWVLVILTLIFWITHNFLAGRGEIVKNYGISFGINGLFFIFLNIIFILFLIYFFVKKRYLELGLMIVGGLINLIDRFVFGYVRDYWWFFKVYNNLADWLIWLGIILILLKFYGKKNTNHL
ncbi:MAG: signal peptidase II [Candidatus Shapirobacteria bacterium]